MTVISENMDYRTFSKFMLLGYKWIFENFHREFLGHLRAISIRPSKRRLNITLSVN